MFTIENMNMANLNSLPLYKGGAEDLPPDSVATIGYAVGTYPYRGNNPILNRDSQHPYTALSLNVLFVILLGSIDRTRLEDIANGMS